MKKTKIIFLDIDGVLATDDCYDKKRFHLPGGTEICYPWNKECCAHLNRILISTNALVVISSDWRMHYSLDTMKELFWLHSIRGEAIVGFTGNFSKMSMNLQESRTRQIEDWSSLHRLPTYIAIDDLTLNLGDQFFQIEDTEKGLTSEIADKIITKLNSY